MENYTYNSLTLQLEGLKITEDSMYPFFFLLLISYIVIMVMNIGISVLIFTDNNLHQPMFFLICNLSLSDIIGCTNILPRLLVDILQPPSERLISYYACVVQAFLTQFFGTTSHTVLIIMAFDRYVAICNPLRYSAIMTNKMVMKLTVYARGSAFVLVGILISLTTRLNRCRTMIMNPFCDNASLFKLSCENVFINNVYGLTFTVVLLSSSIGSIILTYSKITAACLTNKSKSLNSKALKTCSTHLCLYLIMLISGFIPITLFINNVYGLTFTVVLYVASIGSIVLTYTKIAVVCLTSKNKSLNSKALKTCSTHLVVYLIMSFSGFIVIILHRFPQYVDFRKLSAILFTIVPGSLNTIIYGVLSKEIRKFLYETFQSKKCHCVKNSFS